MGGLLSFIDRVCVQTAVYWGDPVGDGRGGLSFSVPVEISCRWDGKLEKFSNKEGKEVISKAVVLIGEETEIEVDGYLFLGSLTDLTTAQKAEPRIVEQAYPVQRFDKVPLFRKSDQFVRTVYL